MSKVITVFGGLGAQGSSVVDALLKRAAYKVRVATRDVNSEKAKAAAAKGAELVNAAYDDYPSLVNALKGAHGAWFITTFWEVKDSAKEIAQGAAVAKAAKEVGLNHLVFSSLDSPKKVGVTQIAFEDKVDIENEIIKTGVPYTFVDVAWYLNNLESFAGPKKFDPNGPYVIAIPIGPHGLFAINNSDVGEVFAKVFDNREEYLNKKIHIAGLKAASTQDFADAFNEVFAPHKFVAVSDFEGFKQATAAFGDAFYNMYHYYDVAKGGSFDVELTKKLNPNTITSVKDYLIKNKAKFNF
jgi:uncharacterized protein YbjT (DUF2867 family)